MGAVATASWGPSSLVSHQPCCAPAINYCSRWACARRDKRWRHSSTRLFSSLATKGRAIGTIYIRLQPSFLLVVAAGIRGPVDALSPYERRGSGWEVPQEEGHGAFPCFCPYWLCDLGKVSTLLCALNIVPVK